MRKIILITLTIIILTLSSCEYVLMAIPGALEVNDDKWIQITSKNLFICHDEICVHCKAYLPVAVYNPNNYTITVTADGTDYIIAPLGTLELKEDKAK
jgi:hypothetical protein